MVRAYVLITVDRVQAADGVLTTVTCLAVR